MGLKPHLIQVFFIISLDLWTVNNSESCNHSPDYHVIE